MPNSNGTPVLRRPKKLIVCCDGTWKNSDSAREIPSNVTRLSRAVKAVDIHASPQIVYYQAGVGTGLGLTDQLLGGGTGFGLSEHIREAYSFLANNYSAGDLIYLVGFSRGAFTARSLASLIGQLGLLNKRGLDHFYDIFEDWEHAGTSSAPDSRIDRHFRDDIPLMTPANDPARIENYLKEYRDMLRRRGLTHKGAMSQDNSKEEVIGIQAVACWDTVGALGIPSHPILQKVLGVPAFFRTSYLRWMDTTLTPNVNNAFHALALDEHRAPFSPAVWEKPESCDTNLKQVWFPGAHSGVGGGYKDSSTADISLAWMMDQLSGSSATRYDADKWIEFEDDYLDHLHDLGSIESSLKSSHSVKWGTGPIFRSLRFPQSLAGQSNRCPGRYRQLDNVTGIVKEGKLLRDTNEFIHASVRARIEFGGKGPIDQPGEWRLWGVVVKAIHKMLGRTAQFLYQPAALKDWELRDGHGYHDGIAINNTRPNGYHGDTAYTSTEGREEMTPWWEWHGKDAHVEAGKKLYEDRLGKFELQLLSKFGDSYEDIDASNRGAKSTERVRAMDQAKKRLWTI